MYVFAVALLYGSATALIGAAAAWWVWCVTFPPPGGVRRTVPKPSRAAEVLARLHELATRVAVDVDEHSSQVEEINDKLTSAGSHEPAMIVDVVAQADPDQPAHAREAGLHRGQAPRAGASRFKSMRPRPAPMP